MWAEQSRGKSPEAEANRQKVAENLLDAGADVNLQADVISYAQSAQQEIKCLL